MLGLASSSRSPNSTSRAIPGSICGRQSSPSPSAPTASRITSNSFSRTVGLPPRTITPTSRIRPSVVAT